MFIPYGLSILARTTLTIQAVLQGVLKRSAILWKPRMPTKTIHGVRNGICTCFLCRDICFFNFRMDFQFRGWPPQPQIFSSSSTKITKKMHNFELQFRNVGGCAGYPLSSKSILNVKQMSLPKQHVYMSLFNPMDSLCWHSI